MSFKKLPGPPRDVTRELTRAFQLSNLCRELGKTKIIPGTRRRLGEKQPGGDGGVEERPAEYPKKSPDTSSP